MLKDYYEILKVPTNATLPEIRKAYRSLAMLHHPDKNFNDPLAAAQFNDIKEAYETLTNPTSKELYLQQRWYNQSIGKKRTGDTVTPVSLLKLSLELERYVSLLDVHRMNKEGLSNYISELISADTVQQLRKFNDHEVSRRIVMNILKAARPLPPKFIAPTVPGLKQLAGDHEDLLQEIEKFLVRSNRNFLWKRYKVVLMLLFTLLICVLIFVVSR